MPELGSLDEGRVVGLSGRSLGPWARRALLAALAAFALLALLGTFGQSEDATSASSPAAELKVSVPQRLRSGLLYQGLITVKARRAIQDPRLVLGTGWFDGMTLNTTEPQPSDESNRDGKVAMSFDSLAAGERLRVWLEFQVNATTTGDRPRTLELLDGDRRLATLNVPTTIFP